MRDALFRAAQLGNYFPMEEPVAQQQDLTLTREMFETSFYEVGGNGATPPDDEDRMILWPYPKGTSDCIDRANCADDFLRSHPDYRVVTDVGLATQPDLSVVRGDILTFAPFETIVPELLIDEGVLMFRGRPAHAMMNELSLGYLYRKGIIDFSTGAEGTGLSDLETTPRLSTHFINGTRIGLSKAAQMEHFSTQAPELEGLDVRPIEHGVVYNDDQFLAVASTFLDTGTPVVVRPFSASQGTGVSFLNAKGSALQRETETLTVSSRIKAQMEKKYGAEACYPLTLSPFVESTKIRGCVTDTRIFVVYDPNSGGLRSLPGMVRVAQVPLGGNRKTIDPACAATNLNIPPAPDAVLGPRVLPAAHEQVLEQLGVNRERLLALGKAATLLWGRAIELERAKTPHNNPQFSYGSVDFLFAASDGRGVPIEMNGNNVGSHPAVHPHFLGVFGASTTFSLENIGLGKSI